MVQLALLIRTISIKKFKRRSINILPLRLNSIIRLIHYFHLLSFSFSSDPLVANYHYNTYQHPEKNSSNGRSYNRRDIWATIRISNTYLIHINFIIILILLIKNNHVLAVSAIIIWLISVVRSKVSVLWIRKRWAITSYSISSSWYYKISLFVLIYI